MMYLEASCRYGNFDWAHPNEKQWSLHVEVNDGNGSCLIYSNTHLEHELYCDQDADHVLSDIRHELQNFVEKHRGFGVHEEEAMLAFLDANEEAILSGTAGRQIASLTVKKQKIDDRISHLTKFVLENANDNESH